MASRAEPHVILNLSPGTAPSAITVGAVKTQITNTRTDGLIADYSSRGPSWYDGFAKPGPVSPGHRLLSAATTALCTARSASLLCLNLPRLSGIGTMFHHHEKTCAFPASLPSEPGPVPLLQGPRRGAHASE